MNTPTPALSTRLRTGRLVAPLLAALLLVLVAVPSTRAGETTGDPDLTLANVELVPIHEAEWAVLVREHPKLVFRLQLLGKRAARVYEHLKSRPKKDDAGAKKLFRELQRIARTMQPDLARLREAVAPFGVTDEVLAVLREVPRGARRVERHAVRLVLGVPDLTPAQRAIHERLVPAVEGALLALASLRDGASEDEKLASVLGSAEADLLKRFYRVVDATLDAPQRAWVRRRLPTKTAKVGDPLGHVFLLPGISASQGARLRSLLVRLEAESAPDQALVKRAERALADDALAESTRREQRRRKEEAERRNLDRFVSAYREGLAILTPAQRRELEALPPLLSAQERVGDLKADLAGLDLEPGQAEALRRLAVRYGPVKGRLAQRMVRIEAMGEGHGPDSPQREALEVLRLQAFAEAMAEGRSAAREVFSDVLSTEQVLLWVLGPPRD